MLYDLEAQQHLRGRRVAHAYPPWYRRVNYLREAAAGATLLGLGALPELARMALRKKRKRGSGTPATSAPKRRKVTDTKRKPMAYGRKRKSMPFSLRKRRRGRRSRRRARAPVLTKKLIAAVKRQLVRAKRTSTIQEWRKQRGTQFSSSVNTVAQSTMSDGLTSANFKAVIDATMPEIDGTGITYQDLTQANSNAKVKLCKGSFVKFMLRNNFNYACTLIMYHMMCKDNTTSSSNNVFESRNDHVFVDDTQTAVLNAEDYLVAHPSDSLKHTKKWKMVSKKKVVINPGEEKTIFFWYKPGVFDVLEQSETNATYMKNFGQQILYRMHGCVAHDSATEGNVGFSDAKLDAIQINKWKFQVIGGSEVRKVEIVDDLDTLLNPEITVPTIEEQTEYQG